MFDKIGGMPLHPLAVHAAVVGIPLAVLLAILFAIPRTRQWARWPLALASLGAAGATLVSKESGEAFERSQNVGGPAAQLVDQHAHLADQLFLIMVGFAAVGVASALLVSRRIKAADGKTTVSRGPLNIVLVILLVVLALVAALWVVRVGDLGARAVWNPSSTSPF